MLAISVWEALRDAAATARTQRGHSSPLHLNAPATPERLLMAIRGVKQS